MPCHLSMHLCTLSLRVFVLATLLVARSCGCIEAAARLGCQIGASAPVERAWVAPGRRPHGFLMSGVWFDGPSLWPASLSVSDVCVGVTAPDRPSRLLTSLHARRHAVRPRNSHPEPKPAVCVLLLFFVLPLEPLALRCLSPGLPSTFPIRFSASSLRASGDFGWFHQRPSTALAIQPRSCVVQQTLTIAPLPASTLDQRGVAPDRWMVWLSQQADHLRPYRYYYSGVHSSRLLSNRGTRPQTPPLGEPPL